MHQQKIILASASPRRSHLMKEIGLDFEVYPSNVDETAVKFKTPREFAIKAALAKALDVSKIKKDCICIGSDTIVCMDDKILGKPSGIKEAEKMLISLRGRTHQVITGVAIINSSGTMIMDAEVTDVIFRNFTDDTLEKYLATGESLDKAGAYGIQGEGKCLVEKISGDYYNVVGLPLNLLLKLLSEFKDVSENLVILSTFRHPFEP
jgi:nucleoside triphosphate pyrophosphatase